MIKDVDAHHAYMREYMRRRYAAAKAAGMCVRCGKAPARDGKTECKACAEFLNAKKLAKLKANPAEYARHLARVRKHGAETRARRIAAGKCPRCGAPAAEGVRLCERCREHAREYMHARYLDKRAKK